MLYATHRKMCLVDVEHDNHQITSSECRQLGAASFVAKAQVAHALRRKDLLSAIISGEFFDNYINCTRDAHKCSDVLFTLNKCDAETSQIFDVGSLTAFDARAESMNVVLGDELFVVKAMLFKGGRTTTELMFSQLFYTTAAKLVGEL